MAQASVLPPSHLEGKLERTVKNVRRMRRLLNRLREQMYEALDKPIPVRSFVRDHKAKATPLEVGCGGNRTGVLSLFVDRCQSLGTGNSLLLEATGRGELRVLLAGPLRANSFSTK